MTYQEINEFYKTLYNKDFPRSTASKWVKDGRLIAKKLPNGKWDYDFDCFKEVVTSPEYAKKLKASKCKPEDFIGTIHEQLYIKGIVPKNEKEDKNYKGNVMYCDCLRCGKKNVQVRFSYLTPNGNYSQETCGCGRKERAFLASSREDLTYEMLQPFSEDFEKFLVVHKLLSRNTDKYYTECPIDEYCNALQTLYDDINFNLIYKFWQDQKKTNTFYDWAKPSLDHIIPKSKGGTNQITNLQVLTVFENLAKRDMTWEEWEMFKKETNTKSDYFIEQIKRKNIL